MKKAIAVILVLCLLTTSFAGTVFAQTYNTKTPPLSMQILGKKISSASPPIVKNNRVYLPLRAVGEALGYKVSWNAKAATMELKSASPTIKITIGSKTAYVNGKKVTLDTAPIMHNERAHVPLTFVQKHFNFSTTYDKTKNIVSIEKKTAAATSTVMTKGVYVLGKKMTATDLAVTKNNKVFIPLRHIGEGLGYKVTWTASKNTMLLESAAGSCKVVIGSTNAVVNGKTVKVDPAPFLHNGRAYVPLAFIQNNFDYEVAYDKAKNIVTVDKKKPPVVVADKPKEKPEEKPIEFKAAKIEDIIYDDNGGFPQLNIVADTAIKYKSYSMYNPDRMVVDIENATLNTEFETKEIGKGGVLRARVSQFSRSPNVVRVVIDLEDQTRCKVVQSNDMKSVSLIYANIINPVSFIKEADKNVLMIRGSQDVDPNIFKLENPDRLVVDVYKSVLSEKQTVEANTPFVKTIRSGQADVGVARVVLDLEPGMYYDYETEGNLVKVYVSNVPFNFFDYKKFYNSAFIDLSPGMEVEYQPIIDPEQRTLKIMIPKDLDVEEKVQSINDNIMESITVSKEKHGDNVYTVASFKMKPSVEYQLLSPAVTKLVSVKFKEKTERVNQLTVLIDPGHGGKDPGAIGIDKKTQEKELNLDVALRLNRILTDIGFNTMLTRKDDRYVDLASRSGMANSNYVDFFMSIHFNAFTSTAKGIETLYYPNEVTDEYPFDNRKMANIFHSELTETLKRPSRGITPRPGLHVLNKTKMPAILAELGFITNPEELAEIKNPEYREMAARALAASIVRHFKEIEGINLDIDIASIYAMPTPPNPYLVQR